MITKYLILSSLTLEAQEALLELFGRMGWCYDLEEEKLIVNIPVEDTRVYDFLVNSF